MISGDERRAALRVVRYDVADHVGVLTLDRPDRLNAWTNRMEQEYRWCLGEAEDDPRVRVVVVTGAGRGFCAGADYKALDKSIETGSYSGAIASVVSQHADDPLPAVADHAISYATRMSKPVIAAVNGAAAGVGFALACFADLRFAAAGAKFTTSFGRLNLPAEHGVSWILPRIVGMARAADLLLSSRVVLAEEAFDLGLVNRVVEPAALMDETLDYARTMARDISPDALREMKRQLYVDTLRSLPEAAAESVELMERMIASPAAAEATAAWREKRPPNW
jgi:enoyl-CoA hydratase/carnithine racemase